MTPQEIQQRNEQIALMLGLEEAGPGFPSGYFYKENYYHYEDLQFHSDWNWLMEAVEFVKKTSGISMVQGPVKKPTCVIHLGDLKALSGQSNTLKEAVFIAVSDFAKLYNERKL